MQSNAIPKATLHQYLYDGIQQIYKTVRSAGGQYHADEEAITWTWGLNVAVAATKNKFKAGSTKLTGKNMTKVVTETYPGTDKDLIWMTPSRKAEGTCYGFDFNLYARVHVDDVSHGFFMCAQEHKQLLKLYETWLKMRIGAKGKTCDIMVGYIVYGGMTSNDNVCTDVFIPVSDIASIIVGLDAEYTRLGRKDGSEATAIDLDRLVWSALTRYDGARQAAEGLSRYSLTAQVMALPPQLTPDEIRDRCKWAIEKGINYDFGKLPEDDPAWRAWPLKARGKDKSHLEVTQGIHDLNRVYQTIYDNGAAFEEEDLDLEDDDD